MTWKHKRVAAVPSLYTMDREILGMAVEIGRTMALGAQGTPVVQLYSSNSGQEGLVLGKTFPTCGGVGGWSMVGYPLGPLS